MLVGRKNLRLAGSGLFSDKEKRVEVGVDSTRWTAEELQKKSSPASVAHDGSHTREGAGRKRKGEKPLTGQLVSTRMNYGTHQSKTLKTQMAEYPQ